MDRRNWFKIAGLSTGAIAINPLKALDFTNVYRHPLDNANELARLCYNENPYGPAPKVTKAITDAFDIYHTYPFVQIGEFEAEIAKKEGIPAECVVLGGGSRECLNATGLTFAEDGGNMIAPSPTYQAMMTYVKQFGMHVYDVPLKKDLSHDLESMERRITNRTNLIFVCNPNNPTGTITEHKKLKTFVENASNKAVVFVDEAYFDFIDIPNYTSLKSLVLEDRNVVVSKTFSKVYGLAGIRIGYIITRPDIAERIRPMLQASTNMLGVVAAQAALHDDEFYKESLNKNLEAKEYVYDMCNNMGLEYHKSYTNFVFFRTGKDIVSLNKEMRDNGVLVGRPFPPFMDWCRISTGKMEDMERFGAALKKVLA